VIYTENSILKQIRDIVGPFAMQFAVMQEIVKGSLDMRPQIMQESFGFTGFKLLYAVKEIPKKNINLDNKTFFNYKALHIFLLQT
jgi:hypothetical protein